jgi:hypothetical protein
VPVRASNEGKKEGVKKEEPTTADLDEIFLELEKKMDRVRALYESYFMGFEKAEPIIARKDVVRIVLTYAQLHMGNTAHRFRFHTLQQKWNTLTIYWNRTMREIEQGRYRKDLQRLARKYHKNGRAMPEEVAHGLGPRGAALTHERAPSQSESAPQPNGRAARQAAAPAHEGGPVMPAGVDAHHMQQLFEQYVQAKRMVGDPSAETVRYDSLLATVSKQTPQIMQKYGCAGVDFSVVIRENKVVLKATPRK